MILRPLQPAQAFYRFNTPRWAYRPTSGAGAAKVGGRFNRPGVDALYLSRRIETATAEYQQDEPLMPPGTLVTYEVELTSIVDFGKGYSHREWDELWSDWDCAWRRQALYEGIEPPSWLLADIAIECGAKGILFPSTKQAGGLQSGGLYPAARRRRQTVRA
jgi:RES domain-containing protein